MTKPKKPITIPFPAVFYSTGEQHPFLAKYKRSLEKRLSLTRMQTLFEEVDLSIYLIALNRETEALEVASFLPLQIVFTGNYNIWTPTGSAVTVASFLLRRAGQELAAHAYLAKLIEKPSHADREPEFYREMVEDYIPKQLEEGWSEASRKWACHILARTVAKSIYWRETNVRGFHHYNYYSNDVLDRSITLGLERLRRRMETPQHARFRVRASGAG